MLKSVLEKIFFLFRREYTTDVVFGCRESMPRHCPTFIEREVHKCFFASLQAYNLIVVYGESRQGKTWMVDRYCPQRYRIGCTGDMNLRKLKEHMVYAVGLSIRQVCLSLKSGKSESLKSSLGTNLGLKASASATNSGSEEQTVSTSFISVDIDNQTEFILELKRHVKNGVFVFDNFHYLSPETQQQFCSLLKELNYHDIRIIIIGVWKDAARITALAPDLVDRCSHIDVGSWSSEELQRISKAGSDALNIDIPDFVVKKIINSCAGNVGIFKDLLQKYCFRNNVFKTQKSCTRLKDGKGLKRAIHDVVAEAYQPLHDRVINLSMPQKEKKGSKRVRLRIVIGILLFIYENRNKHIPSVGIKDLQQSIDKLSSHIKQDQDPIAIGNLTQELGCLHLREENRQTGFNFIPLFYYDRINKRILVIEPTLFSVLSYRDGRMIKRILDELLVNVRIPVADLYAK